MTVRIGVVGLGRIGALHARNLAACTMLSSLVVHDADQERAREVASQLGADVAESVPELLRTGVDGVVVATPTPCHEEHVTQALQHAVPVFCEKPLAGSLESGLSVAAAADRRGVPLQVGLQRRCDPQLRELRERVVHGLDGRLLGVRVVSTSWRPPPPEYLRTSGGFFQDKLVHDVDVVRWLTGREIEAATVVASGTATRWIAEAGDVDTVSASLLLSGGVPAQIWAARRSPSRFEFRVDVVSEHRATSAGRWTEGEPSGTARGESPFPTFVTRFADAYAEEVRAFCRLVVGAGGNVCPAADALASEAATATVARAWREARVVRAGDEAVASPT